MAATTYSMPSVQPNLATAPLSGDHTGPRNTYKSIIYKLGISEIALGCLFSVLSMASFVVGAIDGHSWFIGIIFLSPGIWCGVFTIISGGLGVCTRKTPSVCMYNANMAMSIISAVFMGLLFSLSVIAANGIGNGLLIALQVVIAVGSLSAMVVSIVHSAYCCAGVCCHRHANASVTFTSATTTKPVTCQQYQYMPLQTQPYSGPSFQVTSIPSTGVTMPVELQPAQFPQPGSSQYPQPQAGLYKQQGSRTGAANSATLI